MRLQFKQYIVRIIADLRGVDQEVLLLTKKGVETKNYAGVSILGSFQQLQFEHIVLYEQMSGYFIYLFICQNIDTHKVRHTSLVIISDMPFPHPYRAIVFV